MDSVEPSPARHTNRSHGQHHHHHHKKARILPPRITHELLNSYTGPKVHDPLKKSRYKSLFMPEVCYVQRTRSSTDRLNNPVDNPRNPESYKPPFRRNFRFFGYPKNLNMALNTPEKARSWGPLEEDISRSKPKVLPHHIKQDQGFDPYWIGRLMKSCLLLENPGLLPVVEKAVINLGEKKIQMVHPEFQLTNCPSELYFPLSEKSTQAYCRIYKIVHEIMEKKIYDYTVTNQTILKNKKLEREVGQSELERRHKISKDFRKKSNFSVADFDIKHPETLFFENRTVSPLMKAFCVPSNYPGVNKQLYAKPRPVDNDENHTAVPLDDAPILVGTKIPLHQLNIPEDIWQKLNKIRVRRKLLEKIRTNRKNKLDKSFNQLELRNQVLQETRNEFIAQLKKNVNTQLPSELFVDNRQTVEPAHNYVDNDEYPPQGPYWWKVLPEKPPTPEELKIVENYISEEKERHSFTHHLPGLLYMPRHPFQKLELDWIEPGAETSPTTCYRKSPDLLHDMPTYIMGLENKEFGAKFSQAVTAHPKDLVGAKIYEQYQKNHHVAKSNSKMDIEKRGSKEKQENVPKKKQPIRKKVPVSRESGPPMEDQDYRLDADVDEDDVYPLENVRFSFIEFPKDGIPDDLKKQVQKFKYEVERATPTPQDAEEPVGSDGSDTSTSSEENNIDEPVFSRDAISHLQIMYQDAVKSKYSSVYRHMKNPAELEPPDLKDIFLGEDYTEDIDHLLNYHGGVPKFLQLF